MEEHAGLIVKGKRTKRQRLHSPVPFEVADSSPTTTTSSAELFPSTTEEEEDMANCLILLAQGHGHRRNPYQLHIEVQDRRHCQDDSDFDEAVAAPKLTTRRYVEMTTSSGGRAGHSVYRCKTCNQTFPSFQALGGHRASHKKSVEKKQVFTLPPPSPEGEEGQFRKFSSLSLQLGNNNTKNGNSIISNKVRECSICGAEFASGQALGGHMRRHRAVPVGTSIPNTVPSSVGAITTLSLIPPGSDRVKVHNLSWDLDLNLPASAQDHQVDYHHHREICQPGEFPSAMNPSSSSSQQQQQVEQKSQPANKSSMVFSAPPALVGCHY